MKKIIFLAAILFSSILSNAQAVQNFAVSAPPKQDYGNHTVANDSQGNVYTIGTYDGVQRDFDPSVGVTTVTNPSGHYVMYILKLDTNGNHIWNKQFYNPTNTQYDLDKMYQLKVDAAGNVYATGCFYGTVDFDPTSTGISNLVSAATGLLTKQNKNNYHFNGNLFLKND